VTLEKLADVAERAVKLNPSKRGALLLAKETAEAISRDPKNFEDALQDLDRRRSHHRIQPPHGNAAVRNLYIAYRRGDWVSMQRRLVSIEANYPQFGRDRIHLMRLRAGLLAGGGEASRAWTDCDVAVSPHMTAYARAIVQLHNWQFADALSSLADAERWRRSRNGHAFILWSRAIALICQTLPSLSASESGSISYDQLQARAIRDFAHAKTLYEVVPPSLRRIFLTKESIPGELAYEPRQFRSAEMRVLLDAWRIFVDYNGTGVAGATIEDVVAALNQVCGDYREDLLLAWCRHAIQLRPADLSTTQAASKSEFNELLEITRERCPGLLRDIAPFYALSTGKSVEAGTYLQRIVECVPVRVRL